MHYVVMLHDGAVAVACAREEITNLNLPPPLTTFNIKLATLAPALIMLHCPIYSLSHFNKGGLQLCICTFICCIQNKYTSKHTTLC